MSFRPLLHQGFALLKASDMARAIIAIKAAGHTVEWEPDEFPGFPQLYNVDGVEITERQLLDMASKL